MKKTVSLLLALLLTTGMAAISACGPGRSRYVHAGHVAIGGGQHFGCAGRFRVAG